MGLLRKAVRRATPRPVRQVKRVVRHPVRTGIRAATPRSIRSAQRSVFNATHPVNTLENALLNSLTGSARRKPGRPSGSRSTLSPYSDVGYATGPTSHAAAYERALLGKQIAKAEAELFSRHLQSVATAVPQQAPPTERPDPTPVRKQLEQKLGATDLAATLAPFGSPPRLLLLSR